MMIKYLLIIGRQGGSNKSKGSSVATVIRTSNRTARQCD